MTLTQAPEHCDMLINILLDVILHPASTAIAISGDDDLVAANDISD